MVVIGGSRGVGRRIVGAGLNAGWNVLAVARDTASLARMQEEFPDAGILSQDAREEESVARVFNRMWPDVLVISAGVFPPASPLHEQNWEQFSVNWESDVRIAFHFCKAAITFPLRPGATIVVIASGAALAGSPNSGGYAGAKKTQLFVASYSQKESDRLGLGLRFRALAPRILPETDLGRHVVAGYARYLGITPVDFVQGMQSPPCACNVAHAVIDLVMNPDEHAELAYIVSGAGLQPVA